MLNYLWYVLRANFDRSPSSRYRNLYKMIFRHQCASILEIGTNRAKNALRMIRTARIRHLAREIRYYGFDLFEGLSDSELKSEFSKRPSPQKEVEEKLAASGVGYSIYKGYSTETLPLFVKRARDEKLAIDFIFVDGGHAVATIAADWNNVRQLMHDRTVVVFDDYYRNTEPDVTGMGCNSLIDNLDRNVYEVTICTPENSFTQAWGTLNVRVVAVRLKPRT